MATLIFKNVTCTSLRKQFIIPHKNIISSDQARSLTRVSFKTIMLICNERPPGNNSQLKPRASETERWARSDCQRTGRHNLGAFIFVHKSRRRRSDAFNFAYKFRRVCFERSHT